MKKVIIGLALFWAGAIFGNVQTSAADCSLVYDEFDNLMNKDFLITPSKYVPTVKQRLSRSDYNVKQKGKFLLSSKHRGLGIGIVRTNSNQRGKFLFTWGAPFNNGSPTLIVKEAVIHRLVKTGDRPIVWRNLKIKSSFSLDLDTGQIGGDKADIWFHNIDGRTMYIEAVNGAQLEFPMHSLCKPSVATLVAVPVDAAILRAHTPVVTEARKLEAAELEHGSGESCTAKTIVRREVTPEGGALITYSDGSTETYSSNGMIGSITTILPDGTAMTMLPKTAAPTDVLVEPPATQPDMAEAQWLESHRQSLLGIIESMVSEPESVQNVLAELDTSENAYESITIRSKIIRALASPTN